MTDILCPSAPRRLILADDHKIVRDGLRVLFARDAEFQVVAEAAHGRDLVRLTLELRPEFVVTDMAMPELNGIDATRQLRTHGYGGRIVLLSMHDERRYVAEALAAGIDGYVHKEYAFEQLRAALVVVATGGQYLSPQLARCANATGEVRLLIEVLTAREREVLQMLAEGRSTKEVAAQLFVSPKTVESHRLNLMAKLRVNNLADLTRIAVKEGLSSL